MFCSECGSIGIPDNGNFICVSCGNEVGSSISRISNPSTSAYGPNMAIPEFKGSMEHECERCGHDKAFFAEVPPLYGDEFSTFFFKCAKCGLVVREEIGPQ